MSRNILLFLRRKTHIAFFLLIAAAAYYEFPFTGCSYLNLGYLRLVCPVGFMEVSLASHSIPWQLVPGFLLVVGLVWLLGRAYCAWVCPASFVGAKLCEVAEFVLPDKLILAVRNSWQRLGDRIFGTFHMGRKDAWAIIIGLGLGITLSGFPAFSIVCPIGVISRNVIQLVTHQECRMDLVLLALPLIFGLLFRHGWKCVCPVGTIRGLFAATSRTVIVMVKQDDCVNCGYCATQCSSGLSPQTDQVDASMCAKCLKCIEACPKDALAIVPLKK